MAGTYYPAPWDPGLPEKNKKIPMALCHNLTPTANAKGAGRAQQRLAKLSVKDRNRTVYRGEKETTPGRRVAIGMVYSCTGRLGCRL